MIGSKWSAPKKSRPLEFVQFPHAHLIETLSYKAEMVGIRVVLTEESYTSQASFLDRDPLAVYDPARIEEPRFSTTVSLKPGQMN